MTSQPAVAAARVVGAQHVQLGKPLQDEVGTLRIGPRVAVAVADGHGSSVHSDIGARVAVATALSSLAWFAEEFSDRPIDEVHKYAQQALRRAIVRGWVDRIQTYGAQSQADLRAYGSTLLFALSTPMYLLLGQIGDGDMLLVDASGAVRRPILVKHELIGDETPSLCQEEAMSELYVIAVPAPQDEALLLLSTDGYAKSFREVEGFQKVGADYLEMIRKSGVAAVERRLEGILTETTSRGSGDDIGLAMIYWSPAAAAATLPAAPEACATVATAAADPVHQGPAPATAENADLQDHGDKDVPCEPL